MKVCKHYKIDSNGQYQSTIKQKGSSYLCTVCSRSMTQDDYSNMSRYCTLKREGVTEFSDPSILESVLLELEYLIPKPTGYHARETDPIDPEMNPFFYNRDKK